MGADLRLWPFLLGILQWLILRRYLPRTWPWAIISILCNCGIALVAVAFLFVISVYYREGDRSGFALFGLAIIIAITVIRSGLQCWVLSRYSRKYFQWFVAGIVATLVGYGVIFGLWWIFELATSSLDKCVYYTGMGTKTWLEWSHTQNSRRYTDLDWSRKPLSIQVSINTLSRLSAEKDGCLSS